jgi:N-acetylglucosamine malate deacetylase 1
MAEGAVSRRSVLTLTGLLITDPHAGAGADAARRRILVLGAHPDDPETGCGGTMARLADAGHDVVAAYLTRGEAGIAGVPAAEAARIRTAEAQQACRVVGARAIFLGQIDGACTIDAARYAEARQILMQEKPDLIFCHWPIDTHRDHRVAALLAYDAWLSAERSFALYYFEVMTGSQTQTFAPTDYVDIGPVLARKHAACFAHRSQGLQASYADLHGRMESFRGMEAGYEYAEAFARHTPSRSGSLP